VKRGNVFLMVLHMPYAEAAPARLPYATLPVSVLVLPDLLLIVEPRPIGLYKKLREHGPSDLSPDEVMRFALSLLISVAAEYLTALQEINRAVDEIEDHLQGALDNREVLQLLTYQKSLVYFAMALNAIEIMLDKVQKDDAFPWSPENHVLLGDALIEIRQAAHQVGIAQDILTQMMDAFASIVSNNLNTVMKFLAAITIVVNVPTLIASLYGMNVPLPGAGTGSTFGFLLLLSAVLSLGVVWVFHVKEWL
jgi:magnesium transporter